jgi:hypothetical protein
MGVAVSISERRQGVSRWREGVGVGVGHVYSQGTVQDARRFQQVALFFSIDTCFVLGGKCVSVTCFLGGDVYQAGEHAMTKLLLEHNADVNARNKNKKTCLHYAARNLDGPSQRSRCRREQLQTGRYSPV